MTRLASGGHVRESPEARNRLTVVFCYRASDSFGGGARMLWRLLGRMDDGEIEPILLAQRADELVRRAADAGVDVRIVPYRGVLDTYDGELLERSLADEARAAARLLQFNLEARRHLSGADVIWCDSIRSVLTLAPYSLVSDAPLVWNVGLGYESTGRWTRLNEAALRVADHVFIEARRQARRLFTARQYERFEPKITAFHKGIDVDRFSLEAVGDVRRPAANEDDLAPNGGDGPPLRVGTAALITPRKGLEHFVDAAADVLDGRDDVEFLIAGAPVSDADRAYEESLRERIETRGIDDRVAFVGWVEEMPEYLASLDVFVLPSLNEGIPGAVREAAAMERAIVATDVGATDEVVVDGETGLLVSPRDVEALRRAIERLLDDPAVRERLGTNARERVVSEFSVDAYVRNYERFLRRVGGEVDA
ncbi:glycosyltransferase family 4 protein [Halovivax sp.]|uniref:glycosyltransferase family 4 protein n=1 Tax=Halovivax sp. TaxID=1935978 RepID=UPI0025BB5ED9|nr:glycosyltransferase family 4 protein [Halovivax sp.]